MTSSLTKFIKAIAWRHLSHLKEEENLMTNLKKRKILIIDDSRTLKHDFLEKLSRAGFNVIKKASSPETILAIMRERPDIIILEFELPLLNGPLLCYQLKNNQALSAYADIPVFFYSSINESILERLTVEYAAQGYIHKSENEEKAVGKLLKFAEK